MLLVTKSITPQTICLIFLLFFLFYVITDYRGKPDRVGSSDRIVNDQNSFLKSSHKISFIRIDHKISVTTFGEQHSLPEVQLSYTSPIFDIKKKKDRICMGST
jgi:hypothetical protein